MCNSSENHRNIFKYLVMSYLAEQKEQSNKYSINSTKVKLKTVFYVIVLFVD